MEALQQRGNGTYGWIIPRFDFHAVFPA